MHPTLYRTGLRAVKKQPFGHHIGEHKCIRVPVLSTSPVKEKKRGNIIQTETFGKFESLGTQKGAVGTYSNCKTFFFKISHAACHQSKMLFLQFFTQDPAKHPAESSGCGICTHHLAKKEADWTWIPSTSKPKRTCPAYSMPPRKPKAQTSQLEEVGHM